RLYSRTHTWVKKEEDILKVGVTEYVLKKLKERISLIEMNKNLTIGSEVVEGEPLGTLYSMPYANLKDMRWECRTFKLTAPCNGEIVMINVKVIENPEIANDDPYEKGWILKLRQDTGIEDLITPEQYKKLIEVPSSPLFETL
ncbi:MAG: glycine cleavage system protein H, partial [Candidatus Freyarchaeota archaeon]